MCHPERNEGSRFSTQGKLREESHRINKLENKDSSLPAGRQGLTPQNDIVTQALEGRGKDIYLDMAGIVLIFSIWALIRWALSLLGSTFRYCSQALMAPLTSCLSWRSTRPRLYRLLLCFGSL